MSQTRWDVIVVGGGAAGLWAAGTAAQRGRRVLVLEKNNKAGVKILMSGGTRCNITHHCDRRGIVDAFGRNGKVLHSVLDKLSPAQVVLEFDRMGVPTKVEETGKVFPVSNRAIDVRDAVVRRLTDAGAVLRTGASVCSVRRLESVSGFEVVVEGATLECEHVLLTTGGLSYSGCGTTGDGYAWVQSMGHTITPLRPALTPLISPASWVHELSGLTLDDSMVTAHTMTDQGKTRLAERSSSRGGFLWTHFGCSGPTAMNVSRCFSESQGQSSQYLKLDLLPDCSVSDCEAWLLASQAGGRSIANVLSERIPKRLSVALLNQLQLTQDLKAAELPKRARSKILEWIKGLTIPIDGTRGYPKAEVTAGGVVLSEVNFQDMQSRKTPGLYLAGEILDLDGPIGGFNFQAAWSTGHAAGLSI